MAATEQGASAVAPDGPVVLSTDGLGKRFGGFHALREVSIGSRSSRSSASSGQVGAGKTTLFNLIAGAFKPSSGRVMFRGDDITGLPPHRRLRKGIARTFQLIHPFVSMTVWENVYTAAMASGARTAEARRRADEMVERLGLGPLATKSAAQTNAVEGKRLEVARALATRPSIILLDEIFSGLNTEEVDELVGLVKGVRGDGMRCW